MTPCPHERPHKGLPCPYPTCHATHPDGIGTHIVALTQKGRVRWPLLLEVTVYPDGVEERWRYGDAEPA